MCRNIAVNIVFLFAGVQELECMCVPVLSCAGVLINIRVGTVLFCCSGGLMAICEGAVLFSCTGYLMGFNVCVLSRCFDKYT